MSTLPEEVDSHLKPLSRLSGNQRSEKAKGIDPQVLKQITVFEFEDFNPQSPNDTSAESP